MASKRAIRSSRLTLTARRHAITWKFEELTLKQSQFDVEAFLGSATKPSNAPVLKQSGVYAIFVTSTVALPSITVSSHGLLYVGMTDTTLEARSHFGHAHSGFSTFRRSLGALLKTQLGLAVVPRGSGHAESNFRNYRFTDEGEDMLTQWMHQHLLIAQAAVATEVRRFEKDLITMLEPPLNLTGWPNPQRALLKSLRADCAAEARKAKVSL